MKRRGMGQVIEQGDYYRDEDLTDPRGKGDYKRVPGNWVGTLPQVHFCPTYCR